MAWHKSLTGEEAVHQFAIIAASDPGAIGAGKAWLSTSTTPHKLRYRNAANTGWEDIQGSAGASQEDLDALTERVEDLETASDGSAPAFASLTDGATITWATDGAAVNNAKVTLGGNRTLTITGAVSGATGVLVVTQDGVGSRTLALTGLKEGGGLTLSTAPGAVDVLAWVYNGTSFLWTLGKGFA